MDILTLCALPGPGRMSPIPKLAQELWATPASVGCSQEGLSKGQDKKDKKYIVDVE